MTDGQEPMAKSQEPMTDGQEPMAKSRWPRSMAKPETNGRWSMFKDGTVEALLIGNRPSIIGHWSLVIGHWPLAMILQTPHAGPRPVSFSLEKLE
jgi:hypothetical protein